MRSILVSLASAQNFLEVTDTPLLKDEMPWWDTTKSPEERAQALVDEMTFEEKAQMMTRSLLKQDESGWTGGTKGIERL